MTLHTSKVLLAKRRNSTVGLRQKAPAATDSGCCDDQCRTAVEMLCGRRRPTQKQWLEFCSGVFSAQKAKQSKFLFGAPKKRSLNTLFAPFKIAFIDGASGSLYSELEQNFPITKIMFEPVIFCDASFNLKCTQTGRSSFLASSGIDLHLWKIEAKSVTQHVTLSNKKNLVSPPLTSFDWNMVDPTLIGTCSIDTTCTIWNVETQQIKTQLIAHDKEVFDMAFSPADGNKFISVGADGSMRLFDLRALEHSTILFEEKNNSPLLRVAWNASDENYAATFAQDSAKIIVVDLRMPSKAVAQLAAHFADITSVAWAPTSPNLLASADEDGNVFVWDLNRNTLAPEIQKAFGAYTSHLRWSRAIPDSLLVSFGNSMQVVKL